MEDMVVDVSVIHEFHGDMMRNVSGLNVSGLNVTGHSDVVIGIVFSADSERIMSVSSDTTVRWWKSPSGAMATPLKLCASEVSAMGYLIDWIGLDVYL